MIVGSYATIKVLCFICLNNLVYIKNVVVHCGVCFLKYNDLQLNHCNSLQIPHHPTFRCEENNNEIGETNYESGCFVYCMLVNFYLQFQYLYVHVCYIE